MLVRHPFLVLPRRRRHVGSTADARVLSSGRLPGTDLPRRNWVLNVDKLDYARNLASTETSKVAPGDRFMQANIRDDAPMQSKLPLFGHPRRPRIISRARGSAPTECPSSSRTVRTTTGPLTSPKSLLIPLMIINALNVKALPVYGDGEDVRGWLHVSDHPDAPFQIATRGQSREK